MVFLAEIGEKGEFWSTKMVKTWQKQNSRNIIQFSEHINWAAMSFDSSPCCYTCMLVGCTWFVWLPWESVYSTPGAVKLNNPLAEMLDNQ